MKRKMWMVGVLACALSSASARAGFQFNYTVTAGTGALDGKNIFAFYAKNDQIGEQLNTHYLLAISATMQSLGGPFTFDFRDVDHDGIADANILGDGIAQNNITGTFVRIGLTRDWDGGVPDAGIKPAKPYSRSGNPAAFNSILSWGLDGANLAVNTNPTPLEAAQGLGCFFGAAVVPVGSDVKVFGRLAAEKGGAVVGGEAPELASFDDPSLSQIGAPSDLAPVIAAAGLESGNFIPFSFTATAAPEPGTLGLLAVSALGLFRRRRSVRAGR